MKTFLEKLMNKIENYSKNRMVNTNQLGTLYTKNLN